MYELVLKLCVIREYAEPMSAGENLYYTEDGGGNCIGIHLVDVLDQACLDLSPREVKSIFICNKKRKFRYSIEELGIEAHICKELEVQLITHKFFTKMERLVGRELDKMKRHKPYLPILLKTDPMVKVYGFSLGDVVKIYRNDGTIFFRVVALQ